MRSEKFILKYRFLIIFLFPLITLFFVLGLTQLKIESDIKELIPEEMPSRMQTNEIESIFGSNKIIILVLETDDVLRPETLQRVKELTRVFERRNEFERVSSLFTLKHIKNRSGMMVVDPAVPARIPQTPEARESLRQDLLDNPFVRGTVVSDDFSKTAIVLNVNKDLEENDLIMKIRNILEELPGDEKIYMGGLPIVNASIMQDISRDVVYLLPIGFLLMTSMLYFAFRRFRGVLLPLSVVLMAIIVSFGLMPLFGWHISIVTILMPVMLIAVANDYGIHIIAKYNELQSMHPDWTNKKLAIGAFSSLKRPVTVTGITTVAGILGLLVHIIVHARQLGILASIGIVWAVLLSLFFIPAVLSCLPVKEQKKRYHNGKLKVSLLDRILHFLADWIIVHPKKIVLFSFIFTFILAGGIFMLKIDGNMENFFKKKHPVKISSSVINEDFGGSQNLSILFKGNIKDPALLKRMQAYEKNLSSHPDVGDVKSIVTAIREISRGLYEPGHPHYDTIPPEEQGVAQYLELYYMNGDPDDFEQLIDFDYRHAQMIVRINKADGYIIRKVVSYIEDLTRDDPRVSMLGGHAMITSDMNISIVNGQIKSLILAFAAIAVILIVIFRSFTAGLFASLPLVLAEIILFGTMGYSGVRLDAATALLSSIMIGVGVDYTIHFLWRYRSELRGGNTPEKAVRTTLLGSGKGIVFNAWSVIVGFVALVFSAFRPIQYFGFLVVISITVCLTAALVLVPAMSILWKPKFLEERKK